MPTNNSWGPGPTRSGTVASRNDSSCARVKPTAGNVFEDGQTEAMPHPYWPLFDLVVRTPRLTIRYLDDQLAVELAALAAAGIHDPEYMPFAVPWSNAPSPDLERDALRFYWRTRAESRPDTWHLQFATFDGDTLVGSTSVLASGFTLLRTFETGSWLGRPHQGRGIGTEMRIASLHLGFL